MKLLNIMWLYIIDALVNDYRWVKYDLFSGFLHLIIMYTYNRNEEHM